MLSKLGLNAVKVLLYAESVGVVTSGHVIKMAVTYHSMRHGQKPYDVRELHGFVFYRSGVIAD